MAAARGLRPFYTGESQDAKIASARLIASRNAAISALAPAPSAEASSFSQQARLVRQLELEERALAGMQHHVAHHVARELQAADAQRPAVQGKAGHGTAELRAERFDLQPVKARAAVRGAGRVAGEQCDQHGCASGRGRSHASGVPLSNG
jgi:hypothetical protein